MAEEEIKKTTAEATAETAAPSVKQRNKKTKRIVNSGAVHIQGYTPHVHTHVGAVNDEIVSFRLGVNHGQLVGSGIVDNTFALDYFAGNLQGFGLFERAFKALCACGDSHHQQCGHNENFFHNVTILHKIHAKVATICQFGKLA